MILWRGCLLAFNNATPGDALSLSFFMALQDLGVELTLNTVKISKRQRKGKSNS